MENTEFNLEKNYLFPILSDRNAYTLFSSVFCKAYNNCAVMKNGLNRKLDNINMIKNKINARKCRNFVYDSV